MGATDPTLKSETIRRDSEGNIVNMKQVWVNEKGKLVNKADTKVYQIDNKGKEVEKAPQKKSDTWRIMDFIPVENKALYSPSKEYIIWTETDKAEPLYEFALFLQKNKKLAIFTHNFRGVNSKYIAMIEPDIKQEGKKTLFRLIATMTQGKRKTTHYLDLEAVKTKAKAVSEQSAEMESFVSNMLKK
jgi:hypothetical protein